MSTQNSRLKVYNEVSRILRESPSLRARDLSAQSSSCGYNSLHRTYLASHTYLFSRLTISPQDVPALFRQRLPSFDPLQPASIRDERFRNALSTYCHLHCCQLHISCCIYPTSQDPGRLGPRRRLPSHDRLCYIGPDLDGLLQQTSFVLRCMCASSIGSQTVLKVTDPFMSRSSTQSALGHDIQHRCYHCDRVQVEESRSGVCIHLLAIYHHRLRRAQSLRRPLL